MPKNISWKLSQKKCSEVVKNQITSQNYHSNGEAHVDKKRNFEMFGGWIILMPGFETFFTWMSLRLRRFEVCRGSGRTGTEVGKTIVRFPLALFLSNSFIPPASIVHYKTYAEVYFLVSLLPWSGLLQPPVDKSTEARCYFWSDG